MTMDHGRDMLDISHTVIQRLDGMLMHTICILHYIVYIYIYIEDRASTSKVTR